MKNGQRSTNGRRSNEARVAASNEGVDSLPAACSLPPAIYRRGDSRVRPGFTLIELLLALVIFGVISVTIAAVMSFGVEAWRTGTTIADEGRNADAVMEQITMALRSAYYPETRSPTYEYGFKHDDDGDSPNAADSVSWVKIGNSLIGEDVPWAGAAHRVELSFNDGKNNDGPGLYVKAWQLAGLDDEFDPEEDVTPLLISDQVVSFNVRMRDPDYTEEPGQPYEWLDEWMPSNRIPTHVLVTIAVKPPTEKGDPLEYTRMINIPMSSLSWNPVNTSRGSGGNAGRGGNAGGGSGGGIAPPSGGNRPGRVSPENYPNRGHNQNSVPGQPRPTNQPRQSGGALHIEGVRR